MPKSKPKIDKPIIIGFDESNNGWGIKSKNPHYESAMIFTGYIDLSQLPHSNSDYKSKTRGIFGQNGGIELALEKGTDYLAENPNFFYIPIKKELRQGELVEVLKAKALVTLTLKFLLNYQFNQDEIGIITDEFDGPQNSDRVHKLIDWWFEKLGIEIPHTYKRNADSRVCSVIKADRVSYYIGAIHHLGDNHKWPYGQKKVNLNDLEKLAVELEDKKETNYPEPQ